MLEPDPKKRVVEGEKDNWERGFRFQWRGGGREACGHRGRAARRKASARPAPGPAPLLDNSAAAFTNAAVTPISQLGTWKARGLSGCGLCRGGGWHRCPSCPAPPSPCPSTSDQTHTHHTYMLQCLEQCEEQRPCSRSGIKLAVHRGSCDGRGVHRASEKQWSQSGGGEVGCFLYSWERFLFSIFLFSLAGVSVLLIWKHVLTGEGQGNKSNRLPPSLSGPYQLLPPPQRSPSSKSCPPSFPFLFPPNLVALTCTFGGRWWGGMCSGPALAQGLHGHSCPHLY